MYVICRSQLLPSPCSNSSLIDEETQSLEAEAQSRTAESFTDDGRFNLGIYHDYDEVITSALIMGMWLPLCNSDGQTERQTGES